jgi:hypothetical protein
LSIVSAFLRLKHDGFKQPFQDHGFHIDVSYNPGAEVAVKCLRLACTEHRWAMRAFPLDPFSASGTVREVAAGWLTACPEIFLPMMGRPVHLHSVGSIAHLAWAGAEYLGTGRERSLTKFV